MSQAQQVNLNDSPKLQELEKAFQQADQQLLTTEGQLFRLNEQRAGIQKHIQQLQAEAQVEVQRIQEEQARVAKALAEQAEAVKLETEANEDIELPKTLKN